MSSYKFFGVGFKDPSEFQNCLGDFSHPMDINLEKALMEHFGVKDGGALRDCLKKARDAWRQKALRS